MKILLTGATGFIGAHAARALLSDGHEVHALFRPAGKLDRIADLQSSLHLIAGDVLEGGFRLPPITFDLCLHCAWYVEPGKYLESPANREYIAASLRLARQLLANGCGRLIVTGTCFEYDLAATADRPLTENSSTGPRTLYAESKLSLLKQLQQLPLDLTWARLFYQYGPTEDPRRLTAGLINNLLRGQPCRLTPGGQVRDFLHVADVGRALAAIARAEMSGVVNIGSQQPVTVRDMAEIIGRILNKNELLQIGVLPYRPADPMFVLADNTRLRSTRWAPKFTLEAGLRQTIEWWKTQSSQGT